MKKVFEVKRETAGKLIQYCREQANMSQNDLATYTEIPATSICKYEKGSSEPVYSRFAYIVGYCGYDAALIKQGKCYIDIDDLKGWREQRIASGKCSFDDMQALGAFIERCEDEVDTVCNG